MEGGERASFSGITRESGPEGRLKECQSQSSTPSPGDSSGGVDDAPPGSGMMIGISSSSRDQDTARKNLGDGSRSTGSIALSMTSPSSSLPLFPPPPLINTVTSSSEYFLSQKRGRGRPPGSGNRQLLATLGEWFAHSAGGNFTPHVVTIAAGEDVAARIMSFSQKGPRGICILSANGAISNVALRQPGSSGGTLTYEGRFEILSLSGSFTITESNGVRSRTGGISISLAGPDGRVVGGGVAGLLLAASPIQVVVGSFLPNTLKEHRKRCSTNPESWNGLLSSGNGKPRPIMPQQINYDDHECETPTTTTASNPNSVAADWHGLQHSSAERHEPSPDINLSLPPGQ